MITYLTLRVCLPNSQRLHMGSVHKAPAAAEQRCGTTGTAARGRPPSCSSRAQVWHHRHRCSRPSPKLQQQCTGLAPQAPLPLLETVPPSCSSNAQIWHHKQQLPLLETVPQVATAGHRYDTTGTAARDRPPSCSSRSLVQDVSRCVLEEMRAPRADTSADVSWGR